VRRFDRWEQKKITDFRQHHLAFIEEWYLTAKNVHENDELLNNSDYRRYQAWYQGATRCKLRQQWTTDDYADIDSSDDEDTTYNQSTRLGTKVEVAPILDRVVSFKMVLLIFNTIHVPSVCLMQRQRVEGSSGQMTHPKFR
jgi:hypothetical protein